MNSPAKQKELNPREPREFVHAEVRPHGNARQINLPPPQPRLAPRPKKDPQAATNNLPDGFSQLSLRQISNGLAHALLQAPPSKEGVDKADIAGSSLQAEAQGLATPPWVGEHEKDWSWLFQRASQWANNKSSGHASKGHPTANTAKLSLTPDALLLLPTCEELDEPTAEQTPPGRVSFVPPISRPEDGATTIATSSMAEAFQEPPCPAVLPLPNLEGERTEPLSLKRKKPPSWLVEGMACYQSL